MSITTHATSAQFLPIKILKSNRLCFHKKKQTNKNYTTYNTLPTSPVKGSWMFILTFLIKRLNFATTTEAERTICKSQIWLQKRRTASFHLWSAKILIERWKTQNETWGQVFRMQTIHPDLGVYIHSNHIKLSAKVQLNLKFQGEGEKKAQ